VANAHGKDSVFKIEDSAATTLRDITPYIKSVDFNQSQDANDTTTKGAEGKSYRPGLTDGEVRLTGLWDQTASTGSNTVLQSLVGIEVTVGFEWGPQGSTSGQVKKSGECVLTQYDESSPVDDMVAFTSTLKISGDVTLGTWP
jgi:predicted secreted protein